MHATTTTTPVSTPVSVLHAPHVFAAATRAAQASAQANAQASARANLVGYAFPKAAWKSERDLRQRIGHSPIQVDWLLKKLSASEYSSACTVGKARSFKFTADGLDATANAWFPTSSAIHADLDEDVYDSLSLGGFSACVHQCVHQQHDSHQYLLQLAAAAGAVPAVFATVQLGKTGHTANVCQRITFSFRRFLDEFQATVTDPLLSAQAVEKTESLLSATGAIARRVHALTDSGLTVPGGRLSVEDIVFCVALQGDGQDDSDMTPAGFKVGNLLPGVPFVSPFAEFEAQQAQQVQQTQQTQPLLRGLVQDVAATHGSRAAKIMAMKLEGRRCTGEHIPEDELPEDFASWSVPGAATCFVAADEEKEEITAAFRATVNARANAVCKRELAIY